MLVVLDTNVLVSGLLSPKGPPAWIVELALAQELTLVVDARILAEYHDVLFRPELKLPVSAVTVILESIEAHAIPVAPKPLPVALPDPDDEAFLACAAATNAVLVTGNLRHYPQRARGDTRVWSPREFFEYLRTHRT